MGEKATHHLRADGRGLYAAVVREARAIKPREASRAILAGFKENDLLTYASAISFQVFFALIPLLLLGLGLLGAFGLSEVWSSDVAPELKSDVSPAAFQLIDQTVTGVLAHKQIFWASLGALIATWEVSGATRATMQVLNRVYGCRDPRSFRSRMFLSIWLSAVVAVMLLMAVACVKVAPVLLGGLLGNIVGWAIAVALLGVVIGMVVRFAPATERPMRWVSFGVLLVIVSWVVASLVYGWYVTSVADYGSIFGNLAVVMVTLSYLYVSSIAFLTGVQLDALIRTQVERPEACEPETEDAARQVIVARSLPVP